MYWHVPIVFPIVFYNHLKVSPAVVCYYIDSSTLYDEKYCIIHYIEGNFCFTSIKYA